MAELKDRINTDVKTAMRSKDKDRLLVLRMITAAIKQKEVDDRIEVDDAQTLGILDKMAKQHRDSIEQYDKAGRTDLVDKEKFELDIIQSYLPQPLSDDEIDQLIQDVIDETGATSIKEMGKIMGMLKPRVQGRCDMGKISGLIKSKLG